MDQVIKFSFSLGQVGFGWVIQNEGRVVLGQQFGGIDTSRWHTLVSSVFLYACETWTILAADIKRL